MTEIQDTGSMSYLTRCMIVCGLLFLPLTGANQTEETSKACYGSPGLSCTSHHLNCVTGTIAIREAYYTDYAQCEVRGLSSCSVSVDNITDTGNHEKFNTAEWDKLQRNCSSKSTCQFKAGRNRMGFSVVKYNCIQSDVNGMSSTLSHTESQSSTGSSTLSIGDVNGMSSNLLPTEPQSSKGSSTLSIGPSFSTGALVGSLVACALIIAGVAFITVLYLRKRKRQKTKKGGNTIPQKISKETYSLANGIQENLYFELENPTPEPEAVQYDYATADGLRIHNKDVNGEGDYDHTGDKQSPPTGDYDTAASVASKVGPTKKGNIRVQDGDVYSYDHLNGATDSANGGAADYDTTVSSKNAVSKLNSKSNNVQEDDYSYNHLGSNHQVKTIQNEYDTTPSAMKAVARLDKTSVAEENNYDHVNGNNGYVKGNIGYSVPASPYDTAGNVSDRHDDCHLAGTVTDPYDLAK